MKIKVLCLAMVLIFALVGCNQTVQENVVIPVEPEVVSGAADVVEPSVTPVVEPVKPEVTAEDFYKSIEGVWIENGEDNLIMSFGKTIDNQDIMIGFALSEIVATATIADMKYDAETLSMTLNMTYTEQMSGDKTVIPCTVKKVSDTEITVAMNESLTTYTYVAKNLDEANKIFFEKFSNQ